jgi:septum site-determining protein MinD
MAEDCDAGTAYFDIVDRFLGEEVPYRFLDVQKKGFFSRFFGS